MVMFGQVRLKIDLQYFYLFIFNLGVGRRGQMFDVAKRVQSISD